MNESVELPMPTGSIVVSSQCFNEVIEELKRKTSPASAQQTKRKAVEVVLNAIKAYERTFGYGDVGVRGSGGVASPYTGNRVASQVNGLLYGRVQSGKTNASIATVALASGNGFRCFVVLTSDNTWLGKQTADRFRQQLAVGGGPIVASWEDWRIDPVSFARSRRSYVNDTGIVLVCTKNTKNLENLATVLKHLDARDVPGMILDDEADNASLNTNASKMARGKTSDPSKIFELIGTIREEMPNHVFVQVTATPQSLLLQSFDHPLRPAWVTLVEPGEDYIGGEVFFEDNAPYILNVDGTEIGALRAGRVTPGSSLEIPPGLAQAVCLFATATAVRQLEYGNDEVLSMLIHIDHKKVSHQAVRTVVEKYLMHVDKSLRSKLGDSNRRTAEIQIANSYEELRKTAKSLPALEDVVNRLKGILRNAQPQTIDADNPNRKPEYRPGMNFLIGGNRLGRGVTIEGLIVTYYARDAKTKMMDTVHQHARMFGYRKALLPLTRLFSPSNIVDALRDIHVSDEGTRELLGSDGKLKVKPVWVGPQLRPTRANVLNPADLSTVISGKTIWPTEIIHSPSKLKPLLHELEPRLRPFQDADRYYDVPIEELASILKLIPSQTVAGRSWDDERVQQLLKAMASTQVGIKCATLNVRRGRRSDEGYRVDYRTQQRSGFAEGTQINEAKAIYGDRPVLLLRKQAGREAEHWKNHAFYAPTLIIPRTKFAYVFVAA